jgi:pyruvate dehydrogenase E1 component
VTEEAAKNGAFFRPEESAPEIKYLQERRAALGGYMPKREVPKIELKAPALETLKEWTGGSNNRAVSTTMGFVSLLRHLLKDPGFGKLVVPIVPDEGRTFGL